MVKELDEKTLQCTRTGQVMLDFDIFLRSEHQASPEHGQSCISPLQHNFQNAYLETVFLIEL